MWRPQRVTGLPPLPPLLRRARNLTVRPVLWDAMGGASQRSGQWAMGQVTRLLPGMGEGHDTWPEWVSASQGQELRKVWIAGQVPLGSGPDHYHTGFAF